MNQFLVCLTYLLRTAIFSSAVEGRGIYKYVVIPTNIYLYVYIWYTSLYIMIHYDAFYIYIYIYIDGWMDGWIDR